MRIWDAQSKRNIDMVLDDRFAPGTAGYHILSIEDEMSPGDDGPCSMKIDLDDEVIEFQVEFESQVRNFTGFLGLVFSDHDLKRSNSRIGGSLVGRNIIDYSRERAMLFLACVCFRLF